MEEESELTKSLRLRDEERKKKIDSGEIEVCEIDNPDCDSCGA